jgi:hypothetical protein
MTLKEIVLEILGGFLLMGTTFFLFFWLLPFALDFAH